MLFNEQSIVSFFENPFKFYKEGYEIAEKEFPNAMQTKKKALENGVSANQKVNFWGYNPNSELSFEDQMDFDKGLNEYFDQDLIKSVSSYTETVSDFLDLGGDLTKARIKYTSIARGFFDFSRASKGLIRPVEYYCIELKKLIPPAEVRSKIIANKKEFFFETSADELYCEPRQDGTTALLEKFKDKLTKYFLSNLGIYIPVDLKGNFVTEMGDLRLKFTSTEKKVYAYRETLGGGLAPHVDLFIKQGDNADANGEYMFIVALPVLILSEILEKAGVKTRIWSSDYSKLKANQSYELVAHHNLVKEYGSAYDLNKLGLFTSDPRIFRFLGWNAITGNTFRVTKANNAIDNSIDIVRGQNGGNGSSLSIEQIKNEFQYLRNYYVALQKEGVISQSQVSKDLMILGGVEQRDLSKKSKLYDADGSLNKNTKDAVIKNFSKTADYVSLTLSKNPKKVLLGIFKRLDDSGKTEAEINYYFKEFYNEIINNVSYTPVYTGNNLNMKRGSSTVQEIEDGKSKRREYAILINEFMTENKINIV